MGADTFNLASGRMVWHWTIWSQGGMRLCEERDGKFYHREIREPFNRVGNRCYMAKAIDRCLLGNQEYQQWTHVMCKVQSLALRSDQRVTDNKNDYLLLSLLNVQGAVLPEVAYVILEQLDEANALVPNYSSQPRGWDIYPVHREVEPIGFFPLTAIICNITLPFRSLQSRCTESICVFLKNNNWYKAR